jgi:hypothetical protein
MNQAVVEGNAQTQRSCKLYPAQKASKGKDIVRYSVEHRAWVLPYRRLETRQQVASPGRRVENE